MENGHKYLRPSEESGAALMRRGIEGEVVMLNLLRFREVADYSAHPELAPETAISGREAYDRYMQHAAPLLAASGGSLIYSGEGGEFFIGPQGRGWDKVLLVRQSSIDAFIAFSTDKKFLAIAGHREAALSDSRLLPLVDTTH